MSLRAAFEHVLTEYLTAKEEPLTSHPMAGFIRSEAGQAVRATGGLGSRYRIQGSPGQGNWARVPWIAIFDRTVTTSATNGYYLVYLFREDMTGVYLSLGQGVTQIREEYGAEAKHALRVRVNDYAARLGPTIAGEPTGPLDLRCSDPNSLGAFYEIGTVCARFYPADALPNDDVLAADLHRYVDYYLDLIGLLKLGGAGEPEDDEINLGTEGKKRLRVHKSIERKAKLAKKAKEIHGYQCMVCGFDFVDAYGSLGEKYIEAHHLTPLGELGGKEVALDPKTDFAVLCANCHRMIHRSDFVGDVEAFRSTHLKAS